jgi:hypothetical protein
VSEDRIVKRTLIAASLLALPVAAPAQGLGDMGVILAPHYTTYTIKAAGGGERSIVQTAIPLVFTLPVNERLSIDLSTAYAVTDLMIGGTSQGSIKGLTDTQLRGNFTLGDRLVVFTVGLNLPTGQYQIVQGQQGAAGQIGNDFLGYPISSMGNGFAGTAGVAFARALGSWNLGGGASLRKSTEFGAFESDSGEMRFTPADEYRLNVGLDRPVGDGQVQLGLSYSAFGADEADNTSYSTGDRIIASGGYSFPVRNSTVFLNGWNLYRLAGQAFAGDAPPENVLNLAGGVSFTAKEVLIQPNLELRLWQVDGVKAGNLINTGVRLRFSAGNFSFYPSVGYSMGNLYDLSNGDADKVTGIRSSLTIRWN